MEKKIYVVYPIVNGRESKTKVFKSREQANNYAFKLIYDKDLQVENIIDRERKHVVEYVCDNYTRFIISRIIEK